MNRKLTGIVGAICLGSLVSICLAAGPPDKGGPGGLKPPTTLKGQAGVNLQPVMAMLRTDKKLTAGRNKVYTEAPSGSAPGYTLYAHVDNGNVTKWDAVDSNGKNLNVDVHGGDQTANAVSTSCSICVTIPGNPPTTKCYDIDCKDAPKPKPKSQY